MPDPTFHAWDLFSTFNELLESRHGITNTLPIITTPEQERIMDLQMAKIINKTISKVMRIIDEDGGGGDTKLSSHAIRRIDTALVASVDEAEASGIATREDARNKLLVAINPVRDAANRRAGELAHARNVGEERYHMRILFHRLGIHGFAIHAVKDDVNAAANAHNMTRARRGQHINALIEAAVAVDDSILYIKDMHSAWTGRVLIVLEDSECKDMVADYSFPADPTVRQRLDAALLSDG